MKWKMKAKRAAVCVLAAAMVFVGAGCQQNGGDGGSGKQVT